MPCIFKICLFILLCPFFALSGEIFADFTVTQEGEPVGTFRVQLFPDQAPKAVANFVGLASGQRPWLNPDTNRVVEGTPFYDGLIFHRLAHNFVIQGGCPLGTGNSGPGYVFQDEFDPDLRHDQPYRLSMAHGGPNTNGSQFFITFGTASHLDDLHTIFGEVISGRDVIDGFMDSEAFPTSSDRPVEDLVMESVVISGSGLADFLENLDDHGLPRWERAEVQIDYNAGAGEDPAQLILSLNAKDRREYVFAYSIDLASWPLVEFVLSLGNETVREIDFGINQGTPRGFIQVYAVDYSNQPDPQRDLLEAGTVIEFTFAEGILTVTFGEDAQSSTWTYDPVEGDSRSGVLTQTNNFSLPAEGFGAFEVSQATQFLRRNLFLDFDEVILPDTRTEMEPTLSFHTETSGWFRELSFPGQDPLPSINGTFTITPAE